ncbi:MAG: hypothetical protein ACRDQ4_06715 [Pseudonocardiaceae bacterium]
MLPSAVGALPSVRATLPFVVGTAARDLAIGNRLETGLRIGQVFRDRPHWQPLASHNCNGVTPQLNL